MNNELDSELVESSKMVKQGLDKYLKAVKKYENSMDYGNCLLTDYEKECIYAVISSINEIINEME